MLLRCHFQFHRETVFRFISRELAQGLLDKRVRALSGRFNFPSMNVGSTMRRLFRDLNRTEQSESRAIAPTAAR